MGTESRAKAFLAGAFGNDLVPGYYSLVDNNNNNSSSGVAIATVMKRIISLALVKVVLVVVS